MRRRGRGWAEEGAAADCLRQEGTQDPDPGCAALPVADAAGFPGAGGAGWGGGPWARSWRGWAGRKEGGWEGGRKAGEEREERRGGRKSSAPPIGLGEVGRGRGAEGEGEGPSVPTSPSRPSSVLSPPDPARLRGGDQGPPSSASRPRGPRPPHSSPPGLSFQSRQIVTLEKELRQGQVCFSLEVSKESNLLLYSTTDVSGASAPRARLRRLG